MKKLSDYKGDEAIELWADLLDPISAILSDKEVAKIVRSGQNKMSIVNAILKSHKADAEKILLRIDPEPLDGLNIVVRLVELLVEIGKQDDIASFFGFAAQATTESEFSGLHTANTEDAEK